jgi:hypothetical protein
VPGLRLLNEVLAWVLALEAVFVRRRRRLPVGTSLIAVARQAASSGAIPARLA